MKLPSQPTTYSPIIEQRRSSIIEQGLSALERKMSTFFSGVGVPDFTPPGRALYIRQDGGANTTLYVYEGSSWVAK